MLSHGDVVHHLVRRGVQTFSDQSPDDILENFEFPIWARISLVLTLVLSTLILTSIRYTLWGVVTTLTAVEQPQTTYVIREEKTEAGPDALTEDAIDTEVLMIKQKPITGKIRSAMKHLTSVGGFRARWRGLSVFLAYLAAHSILSNIVQVFVSPVLRMVNPMLAMFGGKMVASVITAALLARISMTWTHVVISEPSSKPWYRRVPDRQSYRNVVGATALADAATYLPVILVVGAFFGLGVHNHFDPNTTSREEVIKIAFPKAILIVLIGLSSFIGITIPALVAAARVQASQLPEEDESIVPFDRSFGGKVVPRILGGTGGLTFRDAWMTYDRPSRWRMLKLIVKISSIEVALHMFFGLAIAAQVVAAVGPEKLKQIHGRVMSQL